MTETRGRESRVRRRGRAAGVGLAFAMSAVALVGFGPQGQ